MKKFVLAFIASASIFTSQVFADDRFLVKDDGGGVVEEYQKSIDEINKNHLKIKIDGMCASACTLVLSRKYNIDICVTPNAVIGVHSPFMMYLTDKGPKPAYTLTSIPNIDNMLRTQFLDQYPDWLRAYLMGKRIPSVAKGDSPQDLLEVKYDVLSKHLKTCE